MIYTHTGWIGWEWRGVKASSNDEVRLLSLFPFFFTEPPLCHQNQNIWHIFGKDRIWSFSFWPLMIYT
jgi:hypothetical protein